MHIHVEDCDDAAFAKIVTLLRADDVEEWRMFAGSTPTHLVRDGYKLPAGVGVLTRIAYDLGSGRPLAVWGVNPYNKQPNAPGWVWLAATDEGQRHARAIHQHLKREFKEKIISMYPRLVTASWVGNPHHHTWLRWLGFKQAFVPWPMGINGEDFIPFSYTREDKP